MRPPKFSDYVIGQSEKKPSVQVSIPRLTKRAEIKMVLSRGGLKTGCGDKPECGLWL